jgi:hypothetical protein
MQGIHGAGAAAVARLGYGAQTGVHSGPTGRAYAIPTVFKPGGPQVPLVDIQASVRQFLQHAREQDPLQFWVTAVGCGLAGYTHAQIAPLFRGAPNNCSLPDTWHRCDDHMMPARDRMRYECQVCGAVDV